MLSEAQLALLTGAMWQASEILLEYYQNPDLTVQTKPDSSPVSEADLASNRFFADLLNREFPGIPLISEEMPAVPYPIRRQWNRAWILDPLDGTKEFIAGNDEFAVNLALLEAGRPVAGWIALPARGLVYQAVRGQGAWRIDQDGTRQRLPLQMPEYQTSRKITALISRSHSGEAERRFLGRLEAAGWTVEARPAGSSYKHVVLAEGAAHLYAKPGRCWEWDTAPGQIILEEAGGRVVSMDDGEPLVYNKESFGNPDLMMWAPGVAIPL